MLKLPPFLINSHKIGTNFFHFSRGWKFEIAYVVGIMFILDSAVPNKQIKKIREDKEDKGDKGMMTFRACFYEVV